MTKKVGNHVWVVWSKYEDENWVCEDVSPTKKAGKRMLEYFSYPANSNCKFKLVKYARVD